ncbi:MAG: hypothetical protein IKR43_05270, partial [Lachnospiraceae bacterium]|nr:hypothetical protein [Lachnospiraceae bacterium]
EEMRAAGKTMLISTHIIDSVDMLWDRALIMQDGTIRADVSRDALAASGRTLEELFFDVTENLSREDMSHPDAGTAEGEAAAQEGKKA